MDDKGGSVEETLRSWLEKEKMPGELHDYIRSRLESPIPIEIKDPKRGSLKSALRPAKSEPRQVRPLFEDLSSCNGCR